MALSARAPTSSWPNPSLPSAPRRSQRRPPKGNLAVSRAPSCAAWLHRDRTYHSRAPSYITSRFDPFVAVKQNRGDARLYLRDVDQAVAKAYRMSRHPSHLMTNAEYRNISMISSLRQPKAPLTPIQLGGPLAAHTFSELHRGHLRAVPLCEARNTKQAHNCAQRLKRRMIRSLGLLIVTIVTQYNA